MPRAFFQCPKCRNVSSLFVSGMKLPGALEHPTETCIPCRTVKTFRGYDDAGYRNLPHGEPPPREPYSGPPRLPKSPRLPDRRDWRK